MTTEATTSTPDSGTSVDQVAAVNALLAQELGFGTEEPPRKEEDEGAVGDPDPLTPQEGEGDESGEANAQPDSDVTWGAALGIDDEYVHLDDNGNVAGLRVKVGDDETVVPVKDLVASYQTAKYNTKKSQALSEERKHFEQVRDSAASTFLQKLEEVENLSHVMHQNLLGKYNGVNWDQLRQENPAEYVAKKDEADAEMRRIQAVFQAIQAERQNFAQNATQTQTENFQNYLAEQREKTLANNPEWHDPNKLVSALKDMHDFAGSQYGITPEEFSYLSDARYIEILKDAMSYRKGQALAQEKVTGAPKFMKGGKSGKPMDRLTQLTLNARKVQGANKINAQAAAVNELLSGL